MAVIKVGITQQEFLGRLPLEPHGMPQDVKLSPDGTVFYVADMKAGGVHLVDGENLRQIGFIATGKGTHGLYVSRDSRVLYASRLRSPCGPLPCTEPAKSDKATAHNCRPSCFQGSIASPPAASCFRGKLSRQHQTSMC